MEKIEFDDFMFTDNESFIIRLTEKLNGIIEEINKLKERKIEKTNYLKDIKGRLKNILYNKNDRVISLIKDSNLTIIEIINSISDEVNKLKEQEDGDNK